MRFPSLSSLLVVLGAVGASALFVGAFAGCPTPPHGEGEGEGEGEGAHGEGEGEGAGEGEGEGSVDPGTNVVAGANLKLEDVTGDGVTIAFRDANDALNEVPVAGGAPTPVTTVVLVTDKAEYHGPFLVAYHGVDVTGKAADSAEVRDASGTIGALGNNVRITSVKASPDGAHLYHEEAVGIVPNGTGTDGTEDLFVDGVKLLDDSVFNGDHASKEKVHFSATSNVIVVGAKIVDALGNTVDHVVRAYTLATPFSGAFVTIADDASNDLTRQGPSTQNEISLAGDTVLFGVGKNSNVVTLASSGVDGSGAAKQLVVNVDQQSFKLTPDGSTFVFMLDTTTSGAIESIASSQFGQASPTTTTIKDAGAVDLATVTATHVVYATSIDATTGNETLAVIGLDGSGDTTLGSQATSDGATDDGAFILFRDNVSSGIGDLKVFEAATGTITPIATGVRKVQIADNTTVVFVDGLKVLKLATLGANHTVKHIADDVEHFTLVNDAPGGPASRVAYSRQIDGIWVATLQ